MGNDKTADDYFRQGSKYLTTYYGQLSLMEIEDQAKIKLEDDAFYTKEYEKIFNNDLIKIIRILKELDQTKYSKDLIKHLALINVDEGSEVLAAKLAVDVERYDYAIQISKKHLMKNVFILNIIIQ